MHDDNEPPVPAVAENAYVVGSIDVLACVTTGVFTSPTCETRPVTVPWLYCIHSVPENGAPVVLLGRLQLNETLVDWS